MLVERLLLFSSDTSLEYIYQSDKMSTLCQNIFINHDKISTLRRNIFINHDKMSTVRRNIFISHDKMPTLCQNIFLIMIKSRHFVGIYLSIMIKMWILRRNTYQS